jgi:hypothetical protein
MYQPISFNQNVYPGDKLRFKFSFYDILYIYRPSEAEISQAVDKAASVSVIRTNYSSVPSLLGESGTIEVQVTESTTPNQIADDIRHQITDFKTVKGVQITEVDKDDGKGEDGGIFSAPKVTTTITTVSIAVIFVVIAIIFIKVT